MPYLRPRAHVVGPYAPASNMAVTDREKWKIEEQQQIKKLKRELNRKKKNKQPKTTTKKKVNKTKKTKKPKKKIKRKIKKTSNKKKLSNKQSSN